jgi:mono/diheme cytochrome c family protein
MKLRRPLAACLALLAFSLVVSVASTLAQSRTAAEQAAYDRGRNLFIVNDCFSCHGWYQVKDERWGDLAKKPLVALDTEGDFLIPFLRHGVQCALDLQTPMMPAYWDLSDAQMADLRSYIHFERQERQYKLLLSSPPTAPGDTGAGKAFFTGKGKCSQCHDEKVLAAAAHKGNPGTFGPSLLRPQAATGDGLAAHRKQLELYTPAEFHDVTAFLATLK